MADTNKLTIDTGLLIDISAQELIFRRCGDDVVRFPVSTALNGPGELNGSECTPRGMHAIRLKIGAGCPPESIFVGRRRQAMLYTPELGETMPERDWILARILWLTGTEPGFNRGGECDSLRRYIYIHGTPDSEPMGVPRSHGCIRMRNADIVHLFDLVDNGMSVMIRE